MKNKPTAAGFYWARWYGEGSWQPVEVLDWNSDLHVYKFRSLSYLGLDQFTWGPQIHPPEPEEGI